MEHDNLPTDSQKFRSLSLDEHVLAWFPMRKLLLHLITLLLYFVFSFKYSV